MSNSDPFSDLIRSIEEDLRGTGGGQPPGEGGEYQRPQLNPRRWLWVVIPLLIFFFAQRYFVQGIVVSGVKG